MLCRSEPRGCPFIIQAHSPIYGTMTHHCRAIHPDRFQYKIYPQHLIQN
jgi:hypothetical protein